MKVLVLFLFSMTFGIMQPLSAGSATDRRQLYCDGSSLDYHGKLVAQYAKTSAGMCRYRVSPGPNVAYGSATTAASALFETAQSEPNTWGELIKGNFVLPFFESYKDLLFADGFESSDAEALISWLDDNEAAVAECVVSALGGEAYERAIEQGTLTCSRDAEAVLSVVTEFPDLQVASIFPLPAGLPR